MSWLLDTCVISEYAKKSPTPKVIEWLDEQDEASLFISVISLGEIEKGILKLRSLDAPRSQKLSAWLGLVQQRFSGRILPLDSATLHAWAQFSSSAELAGTPLAVMDGLIMATAQCHGLTVVTRNVNDFALFPQILNPWVL